MEKDQQPQPRPGSLQDKFRLHEEPVSDQAWTGVQKRMAKKKRRLFFLWWMTGMAVLGSGAFLFHRFSGPDQASTPLVLESGRPEKSPDLPSAARPRLNPPIQPKPDDPRSPSSEDGPEKREEQDAGSEPIAGTTPSNDWEKGVAPSAPGKPQARGKAESKSIRSSVSPGASTEAKAGLALVEGEEVENPGEKMKKPERKISSAFSSDQTQMALVRPARESGRNREAKNTHSEKGQITRVASPEPPIDSPTKADRSATGLSEEESTPGSGVESDSQEGPESKSNSPTHPIVSVEFLSIRTAGLSGADSLAQSPDPDSVQVLFSRAAVKEEPRRPEKAKLEMGLFLGSLVQDVTIEGNGIPTYTTENQNIQARMPASSLGTPLGTVLQLGYRIPLVPGLTMGLGLRSTWIRQKARYQVSPGVNAGTRLQYTGDSLEFRAQALVPDATRTSVQVDAMQELVLDAEWAPRFSPVCFRVMWAPVRFRSRLGSGVPAASNLTRFDWAGLPDMRVSIPFGAGHRIGVQAQFRNVAEGVLPLPVRNSGRQVFIGLGYSKEW